MNLSNNSYMYMFLNISLLMILIFSVGKPDFASPTTTTYPTPLPIGKILSWNVTAVTSYFHNSLDWRPVVGDVIAVNITAINNTIIDPYTVNTYLNGVFQPPKENSTFNVVSPNWTAWNIIYNSTFAHGIGFRSTYSTITIQGVLFNTYESIENESDPEMSIIMYYTLDTGIRLYYLQFNSTERYEETLNVATINGTTELSSTFLGLSSTGSQASSPPDYTIALVVLATGGIAGGAGLSGYLLYLRRHK